VERNHVWALLKNFPLSYVLLFPWYTVWRYIIQISGLLSGRGSVARFAEHAGPGKMIRIVARSYGVAFAALYRTLKKRRLIWSRRRLGSREYRIC